MLIFAMDQLIVLKGVRVHSECVEGRGRVRGGKMTTKYGITNGKERRQKKKNKVTTN